ncbi:hypothetical protein ACSBR2_018768 [Camellia fascicularis]
METQITNNRLPYKEENMSKTMKKALLLLNCTLLVLGGSGGSILLRLYFLRGGKQIWLLSFLETAGPSTKLFSIKPIFFFVCAVIGILTGFDDYLYAFGVARLPISTSALIFATRLALTAGFAFLLVKQKFTAFTINSFLPFILALINLLMNQIGSTTLDFFMTFAASALYGFVLPLTELTYRKAKQAITYSLVMEMQMVISFFATAFCTIEMLLNHDFSVFLSLHWRRAIQREARENELGQATYYVILARVSPVLSLCGFVSYFYGEPQETKKKNQEPILELSQSQSPSLQNDSRVESD